MQSLKLIDGDNMEAELTPKPQVSYDLALRCFWLLNPMPSVPIAFL